MRECVSSGFAIDCVVYEGRGLSWLSARFALSSSSTVPVSRIPAPLVGY